MYGSKFFLLFLIRAVELLDLLQKFFFHLLRQSGFGRIQVVHLFRVILHVVKLKAGIIRILIVD